MTVSQSQKRLDEAGYRPVVLNGGANSEVMAWLRGRLRWEARLARLENPATRPGC